MAPLPMGEGLGERLRADFPILSREVYGKPLVYLDNGATTLHKPQAVRAAVNRALLSCANPGRGGYPAAMKAAEAVFRCRSLAGTMFDCPPERVVFTMNCTHGLNMAIRTLVRPGDRVVISGFEHNAVTRPLHALGARVTVAGRKLFDWEDTLAAFDQALSEKPVAAIFTHVSNVFGYVLPVEQLAELCHLHGVPFLVDAAQSAGSRPVSLKKLGAEFIAMPGHKGLLGPQGTGLLLCARDPEPLMQGGTGSLSIQQDMPDFLPDRGEAGMSPESAAWLPVWPISSAWASRPLGPGRSGRWSGRSGGSTVWAFGFLQARIRQACCLFCRRTETAKRLPVALPPGGLPCGLGYTVHRRPMRAPERWRLGRSEPALARMHRRSKPGAFCKGQLPFGAGTKDRRGHGVNCLKF